ncbi:hypothetical protein IGS61_06515 [Janthinobacterium sp. FW305-129]|nr:hypothetical protein [Janthinobacterium sp. FW305-129]MCC7597131.1 hypothetical protein [Janthinobacterium sp. FW305-129]
MNIDEMACQGGRPADYVSIYDSGRSPIKSPCSIIGIRFSFPLAKA